MNEKFCKLRNFCFMIHTKTSENIEYVNEETDKDGLVHENIIRCKNKLIRRTNDAFFNEIKPLMMLCKSVSFYKMFYNCRNLEYVRFPDDFDTQKVEDLSYMFAGGFSSSMLISNKIKSLNLSNLNTSNVKTMKYMFHCCTELETIKFPSDFISPYVRDISGMFSYCNKIKFVDLKQLKLEGIVSMSSMFQCCYNLEKVIFPVHTNTYNLNDISSMFDRCIKIKSIDLSSFTTGNVSDMSHMFNECENLETVLISSMFDTKNLSKKDDIFKDCKNLDIVDLNSEDSSKIMKFVDSLPKFTNFTIKITDINLQTHIKILRDNFIVRLYSTDGIKTINIRFKNKNVNMITEEMLQEINNTSKFFDIISFRKLFSGCRSLTNISFPSHFDTSKVVDTSYMFNKCHKLRTIDLSMFNTGNVVDMSYMFNECNNLESINFSNTFNTSNVKDMSYMFSGKYKEKECMIFSNRLQHLDLSSFDTSNVTKMNNLFYCCTELLTIKYSSKFDTSNVEDMSYMFAECTNMEKIGMLSIMNTKNVTGMKGMFNRCHRLQELDLSTFNTRKVEDMSFMFAGCSDLREISFPSSFSTSNVVDMSYMFDGCGKLKIMDVSAFETSKVDNMKAMFMCCENLSSIKFSPLFDTSNVTNMSYMFSGSYGNNISNKLQTINLSYFNTSKVENMSCMFQFCTSLHHIKFPDTFDTKNVYTMNGMFKYCDKLQKLDVSSFNTTMVSDMSHMFKNCSSLQSLDLSSFDTSNVLDTSYMFENCVQLQFLDLSSFTASRITKIMHMFYNCSSLGTINFSFSFSTLNIYAMNNIYEKCRLLQKVTFPYYTIDDNASKFIESIPSHIKVEYV